MFFSFIKIYWKQAIVYRAQYAMSIVLAPIRFLFLIMIWGAVFANQSGLIKGYSLESLITYFMISTIIAIIIHDDITEELGEYVRSGNFVVYAMQPIHFMYTAFATKVARRSFSFISEIAPLLLIFLFFFKKYWVSGDVALFAVSTLLAFILAFLLSMLVGSIAFWMTNIRALSWLVNFSVNFAAGLFVPIDLLPPVLLKMFTFLPFQYMYYVPTNIYLGTYSNPILMILYQMIWCGVLFGIVLMIWHFAMKRFSGVGV